MVCTRVDNRILCADVRGRFDLSINRSGKIDNTSHRHFSFGNIAVFFEAYISAMKDPSKNEYFFKKYEETFDLLEKNPSSPTFF